MKIDRKLNLVIPVERDTGTVYVHSMPLGQDVFERYFLVLSKVFTAIHAEGLTVISGPRVSMLLLKKIATDMDAWAGPDGIAAGLVGEIRRLTSVAVLGPTGWSPLPFEIALNQGVLSEEEVSEVENALAFFIVISAMHKRKVLEPMLEGAARLWDAQITYSNITDFLSSLRTSTQEEPTGAKVPLSSIPV